MQGDPMKASKQGFRLDWWLCCILALHVILALIYSHVTILKGGPDETAHFIYIRCLALQHEIPGLATTTVQSADSTISHEAHQPPLYYAVMAVPYALLNALGCSVDTIWRVIRAIGAFFGVLWILSVYQLGRQVFGSRRGGLFTAALVALIPTSAYMAGVVSNDIMECAWFGWALVYIVRMVIDRGVDRRLSLLLGLMMGLAVLTKAQGMVLVPIFLMGAIVAYRKDGRFNLKLAGSAVLTVLAAFIVFGGWWLARSYFIYGTVQVESLSHPMLNNLSDIHGKWLVFASAIRDMCIETTGYFWTPYWLVQPFVDQNLYISLVAAIAALCPALFLIRVLIWKGLDLRVFGLLLLTAAGVILSWLRYALFVDFGANLQGRLFLPVASVLAVVFMSAIQPWIKSHKAQNVLFGLVMGAMLVGNIWVIGCVVDYYSLGLG